MFGLILKPFFRPVKIGLRRTSPPSPPLCAALLVPIVHCQYHGCRWPSDAKSQGISNHDIDYVEPDWFESRAFRVKFAHVMATWLPWYGQKYTLSQSPFTVLTAHQLPVPRAVQGYCQWPVKIYRNSHRSREPTIHSDWGDYIFRPTNYKRVTPSWNCVAV